MSWKNEKKKEKRICVIREIENTGIIVFTKIDSDSAIEIETNRKSGNSKYNSSGIHVVGNFDIVIELNWFQRSK